MPDSILIIDNPLELHVIERQHPDLKGVPLILLSGNFSPQQLEEYAGRKFTYFDEPITDEDARRLSENIHHLLWNWFLDDSGNDLSLIDGCSLGSAFASSLETLLDSLFCYLAGLGKLLHEYHVVYYSSQAEDIFLDVIAHLHQEIGFAVRPVETSERKETVPYGSRKLRLDAGGRKRDFGTLFQQGGWKEKAVSVVLRGLQAKPKGEKRVLLMPSGKLGSYFAHVHENGSPDGFRWILPLSRLRHLFRRGENMPVYYHFSSVGPDQTSNISTVLQRLKAKILKRVTLLDPELLIAVMERHTFSYFSGALNYYRNSLKMFRALEPELAIFSADGYETFILAAQAAKKAGISTAIIPHGLYGWGYSEAKSGRFQVFDYGLAFGRVDRDNYLSSGMDNETIKITSFPYFERFLPSKERGTSDYRKALILSPDKMTMCPAEKITRELRFYYGVCRLLEDLGIELIGIKGRLDLQFRNAGLETNEITLGGRKFPLLFGYTAFPEAVKEADLVIGPNSTALIEANLLGKDYYVYQDTPFHEYSPSVLSAIFNYVNVSFNIDQLRENILKKQPYRPGCSVYDLVDLNGVQNREDLFSKFESGIMSVLESVKAKESSSVTLSA